MTGATVIEFLPDSVLIMLEGRAGGSRSSHLPLNVFPRRATRRMGRPCRQPARLPPTGWVSGRGPADVLAQNGGAVSTWKRTLATARRARDCGDFVAAEIFYRTAAQKAERADPTGAHRALIFKQLAEVCDCTDRASHAESYHRRALRLFERAFEPDHPHVACTLHYLMRTTEALGRKGKAREVGWKLHHLLMNIRGFREPMLVTEAGVGLRNVRGCAFDRQIHWLPEPEVLEPYRRSLEPASHMGLLANYYHRRGWFQCAAEMYLAAIERGEMEGEEYAVSLAADLENYADLLRFFGRQADAVEMARRAKRIRLI